MALTEEDTRQRVDRRGEESWGPRFLNDLNTHYTHTCFNLCLSGLYKRTSADGASLHDQLYRTVLGGLCNDFSQHCCKRQEHSKVRRVDKSSARFGRSSLLLAFLQPDFVFFAFRNMHSTAQIVEACFPRRDGLH
jgi:hypothetical protein